MERAVGSGACARGCERAGVSARGQGCAGGGGGWGWGHVSVPCAGMSVCTWGAALRSPLPLCSGPGLRDRLVPEDSGCGLERMTQLTGSGQFLAPQTTQDPIRPVSRPTGLPTTQASPLTRQPAV